MVWGIGVEKCGAEDVAVFGSFGAVNGRVVETMVGPVRGVGMFVFPSPLLWVVRCGWFLLFDGVRDVEVDRGVFYTAEFVIYFAFDGDGVDEVCGVGGFSPTVPDSFLFEVGVGV